MVFLTSESVSASNLFSSVVCPIIRYTTTSEGNEQQCHIVCPHRQSHTGCLMGQYIRAADGNYHTYCIWDSGTPLSHCRICKKCDNFHLLLILVATIEKGSGQFCVDTTSHQFCAEAKD